MNPVIWVAIGGAIGWVISRLIRSPGRWMSMVTGISGALLGGWVISPLVVSPPVNDAEFSPVALMISIGTAILVLVIVIFQQRRADPADGPIRGHSSP